MSDTPATNGDIQPVDLDLDATPDDKPRTFRLRGEVFRIHHPNLTTYGDAVTELDKIEAEEKTFKAIWNGQADFIEVSVHPDDLERFRAIRARQVESLEPADITKLYRWLWAVHTGRPTQPAEVSSPGPGSSDPSSKAESGSPVVVRPT